MNRRRREMKRLTTVFVISIPVLLVAPWFTATEDSLQFALKLRSETTAIVVFDVNSDGTAFQQATEGNTAIFSNSTYRVELSESVTGGRSIVRTRITRQDAEAFKLHGFGLHVRIEAKGPKNIWYPAAHS